MQSLLYKLIKDMSSCACIFLHVFEYLEPKRQKKLND